MKNLCFQYALTAAVASLLFCVFVSAGCDAVETLGSNQPIPENSATEPAPTPNAQQTARCEKILGGDRRNKPNELGELPGDMPVPRGSVVCGYVDGQRATYYINDQIDKNALAQFFRDALPPQGFALQMDNPTEGGGKFMVFGRGASESIQIQTTLSAGAEFRNMFSVAYMPPNDSSGNALTGTTVMRGTGNSNRAANAPNASGQNAASGLCRNAYDPVGANVVRKYRVTANGAPAREMTETYRAIAVDSFTVHSEYNTNPALKTDVKWLCMAEGLMSNEFDGNALQTGNGTTGKYETLKATGIAIPAEARFRTGERWNAKYTVKYAMNFGGASQTRADTGGTIDGAGEILGKESVTVPAGTFQAFKVRTIIKMNMTVKMNGTAMPMPNQMPVEQITWYAKDVGKVKSVSTLNGKNVGSVELLSYTGGTH